LYGRLPANRASDPLAAGADAPTASAGGDR
jgi:hypothetical protein